MNLENVFKKIFLNVFQYKKQQKPTFFCLDSFAAKF